MKLLHNLRQNSGQTLVEVIIATGIIVIILTTLTAGLSVAVRNSRVARDQLLAKDYVRGAMEWMRTMRDLVGWDDLYAFIGADGSSVTYCLATFPSTRSAFGALADNECATDAKVAGTPFRRWVVLTLESPTSIRIDATIDWSDAGKVFQSQSNLILKKSL